MLSLDRFFINPFLDAQISIDEAVNYSSNHLARMIANNPGGIFTPLILATTTKLTALDATLTGETGSLGVQKSRTLAKDTFRVGLLADVGKIHGDFVASFGPEGVEVMEAFPEGRTVFNTCDDSALDNKLAALKVKVDAKAASLKPANVTLAATLVTVWAGLYSAATTGRGGSTATADARRAALQDLKDQLFTNLLTIANAFHNQTDKAALYCPQQYLEDPASPTPPSPSPSPTPSPTPTPSPSPSPSPTPTPSPTPSPTPTPTPSPTPTPTPAP